MDSKLVKSSVTRTEGSSKRARDELESDNLKKQKIDEHVEAEKDDDQEEAYMKKHIEIVKDDEVAIDAIPLATKPPVIVEYKIFKEGKFRYFQLIRADGSLKRYLSMIKMLQNIDREDLETIWKLVKAKHGNTRPEEDYERIKGKINKSQIETVCNDKGERIEGEAVAEEFVKHFNAFPGNNYTVSPIKDTADLFPKKLTEEEASWMIREVTDNEIKDAMFNIGDNKAPGPNGFTSSFFKKAWGVVGSDVCKEIKEFFTNGKLLGEVNATVISLVPKIPTPNKVTDYRPITCCNVMYKCISKILTNRIKDALNKLVNKNQSAFIPGRWIMTCISSPSFTINVNGDKCGFFKGAIGLRQRDPISPYLFTLIMEVFTLMMEKKIKQNPDFKYHKGCKDFKITHLCFADDLVVMCHGDKRYVEVIKAALDEFSNSLGLLPNPSKSTVFFSNVGNSEKAKILSVMPFSVVYWSSVFLLPSAVTKEINRLLKGFLWVQGDLTNGKAKIAWSEGSNTDSWGWKNLLSIRDQIIHHVVYKIGNGINVSMWNDRWTEVRVLSNYITYRSLKKYPDIVSIPVPTITPTKNDKVGWKNKKGKFVRFSVRNVLEDFYDDGEQVKWYSLVWFSQCIPKHAFNLWVAIHGRFNTKDRLHKWHPNIDMKCPFCHDIRDSHKHLFFECEYSKAVWKETQKKMNIKNLLDNWEDIIQVMSRMKNNNSIWSVARRISLGPVVYFIWNKRNARLFRGDKRNTEDLGKVISETVKLRLMSINVKDSPAVFQVKQIWGVQFKKLRK
ncbi:RNA-directed DNA polymerase, eukaryota, reverse transcriptase zinc-binding domain protein [Tanacetum coccineum]|uniref:RNA-directed DNA polymerase, eukaryota, reverse transcriptase zinc-binding domain protein n=1 Tax=Tanacetum coccineum TaxID=301880 RepID=A0ABQ4YQG8_9ASTR